MSFWIPLILLGVSMAGLVFLSTTKRIHTYFIDRSFYYPLGLLGVLMLGMSIFSLGLALFSAKSEFGMALGTFLVVSGIQITLWGLGIRLDFLGNQSTFDSRTELSLPVRRRLYMPMGDREDLFRDVFRDVNLPMGLRETLARLPSEIAYALDYSDEPYDWTPFLQDLMVSVERLRLQGPEAGRISEKAQQKLVEAIANFRAELFIRRVLRGE